MICSACDYDPDAPIYGQWHMIIPVSAQSLSEVGINNTRNNWKYKKARAAWQTRLSRYVGRIPIARGHRNMFFTRFYGTRKRPYDYGNLVGGFCFTALALYWTYKPAMAAMTEPTPMPATVPAE